MAARLDLEARLRALRMPASAKASSAAPAPAPVSVPVSVPHATASATPPTALADLPVAPGADLAGWPEPPLAWPEPPTAQPRRAGGALGEVLVIPRRASTMTAPAPVPAVATTAAAVTPAPVSTDSSPGVSVAQLLGPAYAEAVRVAQFAIESERRRNAHTAIDAYIRAGQMLIAIGRQQEAAHLQTIVKKKALALLERAEGLSDWVSAVMAGSGNDADAVDAAFAESQRAREQALTEKEALVAKMRSENSEMTHKLNRLVLLTKVRARFRRVLSERRARKAEMQALRRASLEDAENNANGVNCNDVEGDEDGDEDGTDDKQHDGEPQDMDRRGSFSSSSSSRGSFHIASHQTNQTPQEREAQKRDLINELHARIGLPEITALRKFTPLSADATKDRRHIELEDELEIARLEAERLRAAVQEMEEAFQATLEHTRQQSLKADKQKDESLAQMEDELQRVRGELERERRLTASSFSSSNRSLNSAEGDDNDPDSFLSAFRTVLLDFDSDVQRAFEYIISHPEVYEDAIAPEADRVCFTRGCGCARPQHFFDLHRELREKDYMYYG